jgi:hypothetical protein
MPNIIKIRFLAVFLFCGALSHGSLIFLPPAIGVVVNPDRESVGTISAELTNIIPIKEIVGSNGANEIGHLPSLVREYVSNKFKLPDQGARLKWPSSLPKYTQGWLPVMPERGDVVIFNYAGFTGVYSKEGRLKGSFFIGFNSYSIGGIPWTVTKKEETTDCDQRDLCKTIVTFNLNGETFDLTSGQEYFPKSSSVIRNFCVNVCVSGKPGKYYRDEKTQPLLYYSVATR